MSFLTVGFHPQVLFDKDSVIIFNFGILISERIRNAATPMIIAPAGTQKINHQNSTAIVAAKTASSINKTTPPRKAKSKNQSSSFRNLIDNTPLTQTKMTRQTEYYPAYTLCAFLQRNL